MATLAVSVLNKRPRPFGQDMASFIADGQDMATFATEDGSVNIEPTNHEDVPGTALVAPTRQGEAPVLGRRAAPVGADGSMLAGGLARPLERQPLQTEEDRLRAEVLQLRAEAAASRGLIEERNRRASIYSTAGGRGTRSVSWIEAVRPLAFHATWNPTFTISSLSNVTFHVARFLRDSLYASNICYNGLHLFSGSYGHADRPDLA